MDLPSTSSILIASDTSDAAHAGVKFGLRLAKVLGADATVIYVVFDPVAELGLSSGRGSAERRADHDWENVLTSTISDAQAKDLQQIGTWASEIGVEVKSRIEQGEPGRQITAASRDYDFVVLSSSGRGEMMDNLHGHVAGHVLMRARCPVVLVKAGHTPDSVSSIVATTDGSMPANSGVRWALALAGKAGVSCEVVHVVDDDLDAALSSPGVSKLIQKAEKEAFVAAGREHAAEVRVGVMALAEQHGVDLIWGQREGPVVRSLREALEGKSLAVVSALGSGRRSEMGHTASALGYQTNVPIMFVKTELDALL